MATEQPNLDQYFRSLSIEQLTYLETLNRKNYAKDKDFKLTQNFNPIYRYSLVKENQFYLNVEEEVVFVLATERFENAKLNSLRFSLATGSLYYIYHLFTSKKTASPFLAGLKTISLGMIAGASFFSYEFARLSNKIEPMFYRIVQERLKRTVDK